MKLLTKRIQLDLGKGYSIVAVPDQHDIKVCIHHQQKQIGRADITTDNIDVLCISSIELDNEHADVPLFEQQSLADCLLKFLIKFPSLARKPEFRFILDYNTDLPVNLSTQESQQFLFGIKRSGLHKFYKDNAMLSVAPGAESIENKMRQL